MPNFRVERRSKIAVRLNVDSPVPLIEMEKEEEDDEEDDEEEEENKDNPSVRKGVGDTAGVHNTARDVRTHPGFRTPSPALVLINLSVAGFVLKGCVLVSILATASPTTVHGANEDAAAAGSPGSNGLSFCPFCAEFLL